MRIHLCEFVPQRYAYYVFLFKLQLESAHDDGCAPSFACLPWDGIGG